MKGGVNRNIPPSTGRPEAELSWQPAPGLDFTVSSRFTRFVITSMVKETAFESDKATFVSDEAMFESNETTFESSETTVYFKRDAERRIIFARPAPKGTIACVMDKTRTATRSVPLEACRLNKRLKLASAAR